MTVLGIDFGTTYTCAGVWRNDRVEIITNDHGNRKTPSCVSFTDAGRLIGDAAINQVIRNPANTVYGIKRLIGREYSDPKVQNDIKSFPFQVVCKEGQPCIRVEYWGQRKEFYPEEILSMILSRIKQTAESYLGASIFKTVIVIPADCSNSQRQAIVDACTISGLNAARVISEPVAVAIACSLDKCTKGEKNVVVFALGGGTLDVSLITEEERIYEMKAVAGDNHLGGEDFDNRLVWHFAEEFKRKHMQDVSCNIRARQRLRSAAERAKRILSSASSTTVEIDSLYNGIDFYSTLTRAKFEELCNDLFIRIKDPLEKLLRDSRIDKSCVDEVILVGGSTRIPRIVQLVSEFFNGKVTSSSVNIEEAAAYGSTVYAAMVGGHHHEKLDEAIILNITPISLGVEGRDGVMTGIIKRNTTIPTRKSEIITVLTDSQGSVVIKVYEGERARTKDNRLLGKIELSAISSAPHSEVQIEVAFDVDNNNVTTVEASHETTGKTNVKTFNRNIYLPPQEIERKIRDAVKYQAEDDFFSSSISAKLEFESYLSNLRHALDDPRFSGDKNSLLKVVDHAVEWLDSSNGASKDQFEIKKKELEAIFSVCLDFDSHSNSTHPIHPTGARRECVVTVQSENTVYTKDHIVSKFVNCGSKVKVTDDLKCLIKSTAETYQFQTLRKVGKVGLMMIGMGGSIGSTLCATILANKYNISWNAKSGLQHPSYIGSVLRTSTVHVGTNPLTGKDVELPLSDILPMLHPNDLVLGGWDTCALPMDAAMRRAEVLDLDLQRQVTPHMAALGTPLPSAYYPDFIAEKQRHQADNVITGVDKQEHLEHIRKDIRSFKESHGLDQVVVFWTASTERYADIRLGVNHSAEALLDAIRTSHSEIPPSTLFAVASILEGVSFLSIAPQNTFVPGIISLSERCNAHIWCRDLTSVKMNVKSVLFAMLLDKDTNLCDECKDSFLIIPFMLDLTLLTELFSRLKYRLLNSTNFPVEFKSMYYALSHLSYILTSPLVVERRQVFHSLKQRVNAIERFLKACAGLEGNIDIMLGTSMF